MASKNWNDLEALQRIKGKATPQFKNKQKRKLHKDMRKLLRANVKAADTRSLSDKSKPALSGYINNVWGF